MNNRFCLFVAGFSLCAALASLASPETQSLAGDWKFRIDEKKTGVTEKWFNGPLASEQKIKLPGTMDDAKLGPKNTKAPTLEGPYRLYDYAGPAWYQRDIEVPAAWEGKRVTLFLERCRWVTQVWLDDKLIGTQDSLIAPHVYDFGTGVAPGKHRLTICVDNTVKIDLGRFVSALFGGTWGNMNGIIGKIELRETSPVWIDDVQVYLDPTNKWLCGNARIVNATGKACQGYILWSAKDEKHVLSWESNKGFHCDAGATLDQKVVSHFGAKLWDEFSPNLFDVSVTIKTSDGMTDSLKLRTGMRTLTTRGTQFAMNGRPVYLRGTLECSIWPLTGYPPCDVESWRRIFQIEKSYGLNFIRFHSWCPPEAAFEAADIEGIMIHVDGPQANVNAGSDPKRDAFIEAEFKRIVDVYGNHPSFCLMTLGNEYGGKGELLTRWVDMLIQRDPRHLYSSASSAQTTANRQWTELADGRGVHGTGTERDLRGVVASDARPIIGHEIGQWMFYPDFNEIKKWTGVMALKNFEMIRDDLEKKHMLDQSPDFVRASGPLAVLLYKEEIEVLMRTPGYAGFSLLDLHDYPTQGTALIGPLDPFWNSKGFITPEAYSRFCGPTVPLLRIPKRTFTADETITGTVDVANYGATDLQSAQPKWKIEDDAGHEIAAGTLPATDLPTGKLSPAGTITASLAKPAAPCKLKLTVSVAGHANDWEIWVYPKEAAPQPPAEIVISHAFDDATKTALAGGRKVLLLPTKRAAANSLGGRLLPVFWSPVWFPSQKPNTMGILCDPKHPLFAQFPTEFYSNWQWWDLLNNSRSIILDDTPADYRPLVQVIDNFERNHKLGNVFEARVGKGALLVCAIDIGQKLDERPSARQFAKSLYAYLASDKFAPAHELDIATLDKIFGPPPVNSALLKLGAKIVSTDSQQPDYEAANAIDGDPSTIWHTAWEPSPKPMPHEIVIDIGRDVAIRGVKYLPRQDMDNGRIAEFEIYASDDGKGWGTAIAHGRWKNTDQEQTVRFKSEIKTRYLKLVARSEVSNHPFASVAEFDIIEAKSAP